MRKTVVEIAINENGLRRVRNVILIDPDDNGGFDHWHCPDDCEMLDDGPGAEPEALFDGVNFLPPQINLSPIEKLMQKSRTHIEPGNESQTPRPADELEAEDAELLGLLHAKLQSAPESVTQAEFNKILQLERRP
jgi:hypothetical protein